MNDTVRTLDELEIGDSVQMRTVDGTTIGGEATVIDFDPEERLRVELEPDNEDERIRYDVRAKRIDGEWTAPQARKYEPNQKDWQTLGEVTDVRRE
ncbi:hypothetical protein [Haladaptatus halobius]|uniref:hypothetical protein n=1 Tax=Haladaptatus halobius TaxID=2884875 RepID=UPI001D0B709B|nr:hypothetical protein [Haladaptatus halobius]